MNVPTFNFFAIGAIQQFRVPVTGNYVITASGAQGGVGGGPGGKGARATGTFRLTKGELLQLVVGKQGTPGSTPHRPAGGGGGGTFVWRGALAIPLPEFPLLAAGGGGGGSGGDGSVSRDGIAGAAPGGTDGEGGKTDRTPLHYSGGGGGGWRGSGDAGSGPTFCGGGCVWRGGDGANYCCNVGGFGGYGGGGGGAFLGNGSGGGGGFSGGGGGTQQGAPAGGGGSYNAGANQQNTPGAQLGDGHVSIALAAALDESAPDRPRIESRPIAARAETESVLAFAPDTGLDPNFRGFV